MPEPNEILYYLLYWHLTTMRSNSLAWRDRIIESQETPGLHYAYRLPAGSPCPFCGANGPSLAPADHPDIPIAGLIRCANCAHIHLIKLHLCNR